MVHLLHRLYGVDAPGRILIKCISISLSILTAIFHVDWVSRYQNVFVLDFIRAKGDGGGEW